VSEGRRREDRENAVIGVRASGLGVPGILRSVAFVAMAFVAVPIGNREPEAAEPGGREPEAGSRLAQTSPGAGPVVVLETVKGTIEFETYPDEAPKTVARIVELVKKNFYNGQRFHRAEPKFLIQIGDPQSRNPQMIDYWGRAGFGKPIGVAEITKKRRHVRGAVGMAYAGSDPRNADSQFYIVLANRPELDPKYTVFGRVVNGIGIADRIEKGDMMKRASIK
jgi:peptidyl-prolyl cis-trans isomerase B (cyclophilin B)